MPGTTAAAGHIAQFPRDPQCDQCRTTATWCFPLTPQGGPQSQPDPARESNEHLRRFAEAEKVAPAPHIRGQLFHCRLHADAFDPLSRAQMARKELMPWTTTHLPNFAKSRPFSF